MQVRFPQSHADSTTEAEHSYMASAADLMIGLLFLFIIMVAYLALQEKGEVQGPGGDLAGTEAPDPRGRVTEIIGRGISEKFPTIKIDSKSGVITLPEELLFESGRSDLKPQAIDMLSDASKMLSDVLKCFVSSERVNLTCRENPERHEIDTIYIEGHTDSRPMPREGGNTKLSLDRAVSVNNALVLGTPLAQFRNQNRDPIFSYSAYAESRPLIRQDPTDARNRRVDLRIVLTYKPTVRDKPIEKVRTILQKN